MFRYLYCIRVLDTGTSTSPTHTTLYSRVARLCYPNQTTPWQVDAR